MKKIISLLLSALLLVGCFGMLAINAEEEEPPLDRITAYQVPKNSIVVDGKVDDVWQYADSREVVTANNGCLSTATFKVLWADQSLIDSPDNRCMYVLVQIDKHGNTVTDYDTAALGFSLNPLTASSDCRTAEAFGIGIDSVSAANETVYYGWFGVYRTTETVAASYIDGNDKWTAEFAFDIIDYAKPNRDYYYMDENSQSQDGFSIGTPIAISLLISESGQLPSEVDKATPFVGWNISSLGGLVYPNGFAIIGGMIETGGKEIVINTPETTVDGTGEADITGDVTGDTTIADGNNGNTSNGNKTDNGSKTDSPATADVLSVVTAISVLTLGAALVIKKKHR